MYKKIITVVGVEYREVTLGTVEIFEELAVYISGKRVWCGDRRTFTGHVVIDLIKDTKSTFEVRYKDANPSRWYKNFNHIWPELLKEVDLI